MQRPVTCAIAGAFLVSTSLTGTAQAGSFLRDMAPAAGIAGGLVVLCAMTKCLGGHGAAAHQRNYPPASAERRPVREREYVRPQTAGKSPEPSHAPSTEPSSAPESSTT